MNRRKKLITLLTAVLIFTLMFSIVAFASNAGLGDDATEDILKNQRFSGALEWVDTIGGFVDTGFTAFISFVAFFIISAACLRNVLAGAYCVFPKFWDKVDEAKKANQSITISSIQSYFTGGGWKNTSTGSISQFILGCLPNVKVLTDFENAQDPDYKQYFMKAIPQCVLAVFMGVFIYNGYYRDVMVVTSKFGSSVVTQALNSVKPDEILYKLTNISGIPDYPIKGAETGTDSFADQYLSAIAGRIIGEYDDQAEKDNKADMYNKLSDWCSQYFKANFSAYSNTNIWKMSVVSDGIRSQAISSGQQDGGTAMSVRYTVVTPISELALNTEYHKGEEMYAYATVQFVNQGADSDTANAMVSDFVLDIPSNAQFSNGRYTFTQDASSGNRLHSKDNCTINGKSMTASAGYIELDDTSVLNSVSIGEQIPVTGLEYESNGGHTIIAIRRADGISTPRLTSASKGIVINVGDSVSDALLKKLNEDGGVTSTTASDEGEDEDYIDELEEGLE